MLAFGALIDLALAPLDDAYSARLRRSLSAIPGRASVVSDLGMALVHIADERTTSFDAELPLVDGDLVVAGTLRIDAQDALRAALALDSSSASERPSDVRLVALAYRRWGDRMAEHLIGDYAFVVWDRAARRVICARDSHGNRQLFWGRSGTRLAVASTTEAVRSLPGVSSAMYERAVVEFLRDGWATEPERTAFREVRRVPAAHTLVFDGEASLSLRRHWDFPTPAPIRYRRDDDYVAHFRDVLAATLRDRCRSTDAAIMLSGGMDSTTLAAALRQAVPDVTLHAFTYDNPTLAPNDDAMLAVPVAQRFGLRHEVVEVDEPPSMSHLDDEEALPSQPLDESDLAITRETLRAVSAAAPIAFYGEDGDTLLQAPTLLGQLRTQPLAEVVSSWASRWLRTGRRPWVGLEWRARVRRLGGDSAPDRTPWMRASARAVAPVAPFRARAHALRPQSVRLLASPIWDALYEGLAPATTRAPLLFTLPLVDPRLLAFVYAIPPVPWCQEKYLFRRAMRDELPPAVLARPKTPAGGLIEARVAQWRQRGGAETAISARVAPWVDVEAVRRIFREGSPYAVIDAWRVLHVDRWLAREERRRA